MFNAKCVKPKRAIPRRFLKKTGPRIARLFSGPLDGAAYLIQNFHRGPIVVNFDSPAGPRQAEYDIGHGDLFYFRRLWVACGRASV
jgi:hypothetical protein